MTTDGPPVDIGSTDQLGAVPEKASIWKRRSVLEMERREFMRRAMVDFDVGYYQRLRALQAECGAAGHKWRFTHLGPLGNPWFACSQCTKSEARGA